MATKKINLEEIIDLTKDLFHAQYDGQPELWFDHLCSDSIYLGTGEPPLFGENAIKKRFQATSGTTAKIIQEEYFPISADSQSAQICGQIIVQSKNKTYYAVTRFTIGFRLIGGELKLVHQHNSYEYTKEGESAALNMNSNTIQFVRNLIIERQEDSRIAIRSGNQTLFINPYTILFIQSQRKRTEFVCIDRIISCNTSIGKIAKQLPDVFYPIHRCYLVNTLYIVSIRRYEAKLISDICVPIPMQNYVQIKKELEHMIIGTVINSDRSS